MDYRSRFRAENVWSTIGFALNGLVFMLIGLELPFIVKQLGDVSLSAAIRYGVIISVILMVVRVLCTLGASGFTRLANHVITTADPNPGWRGPIVFGWAGMRGVVSLAAALSIPLYLSNGAPFPQRNLILFITFTVILITLVFQGLTLPLVVRWVNMEDPDAVIPYTEQEAMVKKKLSHTGLNLLNDIYQEEVQSNEMLQTLKIRLESDVRRLQQRLQQSLPEDETGIPAHSCYRKVYSAVIKEQRLLLEKLNKKQEVDEDIIRKYIGLLDLEEEKMRMQVDGRDD
jgi:CPA1 family monovalent cation:H+ antiporter